MEASIAQGEEPIITTDDEGRELVQRPISLHGAVGQKLKPGRRVRVYNKLRAKLFTSDGFLLPQSEGDVLEEDLPKLGNKVVRVG